MKIGKNCVVTLAYQVTDPAGKVLDPGSEPLVYLHGGYHGVFAALEAALEGLSVGSQTRVNLLPEDAFGFPDETLILVEDRAGFPEPLAVGMKFELVNAEADQETLYTVTAIDGDQVILDGNHPLAGQPIVFHCTVSEVRPARPEEIRRRQPVPD